MVNTFDPITVTSTGQVFASLHSYTVSMSRNDVHLHHELFWRSEDASNRAGKVTTARWETSYSGSSRRDLGTCARGGKGRWKVQPREAFEPVSTT